MGFWEVSEEFQRFLEFFFEKIWGFLQILTGRGATAPQKNLKWPFSSIPINFYIFRVIQQRVILKNQKFLPFQIILRANPPPPISTVVGHQTMIFSNIIKTFNLTLMIAEKKHIEQGNNLFLFYPCHDFVIQLYDHIKFKKENEFFRLFYSEFFSFWFNVLFYSGIFLF